WTRSHRIYACDQWFCQIHISCTSLSNLYNVVKVHCQASDQDLAIIQNDHVFRLLDDSFKVMLHHEPELYSRRFLRQKPPQKFRSHVLCLLWAASSLRQSKMISGERVWWNLLDFESLGLPQPSPGLALALCARSRSSWDGRTSKAGNRVVICMVCLFASAGAFALGDVYWPVVQCGSVFGKDGASPLEVVYVELAARPERPCRIEQSYSAGGQSLGKGKISCPEFPRGTG